MSDNPTNTLRGIFYYKTLAGAKLAAEKLQKMTLKATFFVAPHPTDPSLWAVCRKYGQSIWWVGYLKDFPTEGDYK